MSENLLYTKEFQQDLLDSIRKIEDYPKKGILFRDITTLLNNRELFNSLIKNLALRYREYELDFIVGIESRGFIFGGALAFELGAGFVPIRKKGKLPFKTFEKEYVLEYGVDVVEIHQDAFRGMQRPRVLLIDDLIATAGTAKASLDLIKEAGGNCVEACFLIRLLEFEGLQELQTKMFSVLEI
ncbi:MULTISPECIES: adenine phosphoribosyltransferase [unclassified Helicobacter]|uniref:adenine phosphoribosyltransferase n=1 Tax=unclassified Helicobacter TaxID=2593540 RepID=UPI000CF03C7A|nr:MULTISPECIES: adenine phosphoribosyltransferase [unclassified Helicobacter]